MKNLFFLFFFLFFFSLKAQERETLKIKKYFVAELSDSIQETSGLAFFNEKLYTINDSGNPADIYEIDKTSGKILNTLKTNLKNKDWEAITFDSLNIYIGDFGNNAGKRKDLSIYKIPFDSLVTASSTNKKAQKIQFYYPEQQEFTSKNLDNDFDCESMIYLDGQLHLFTKEWKSKKVAHYIINPHLTKNQPAQKLETYNLGYLATDAAYFNGKLYLIGYTKTMSVFLTVFDKDENELFFNSKPKKYFLGSTANIGQIEGIEVNEDGIYISGEAFKKSIFNAPTSFYFIPHEKFGSLQEETL